MKKLKDIGVDLSVWIVTNDDPDCEKEDRKDFEDGQLWFKYMAIDNIIEIHDENGYIGYIHPTDITQLIQELTKLKGVMDKIGIQTIRCYELEKQLLN